ncbi:Rho GTPase activation protein [Pilobolus umbonatus]|nr:Rho GTPase activation protein [Pilobolus umbonatus]
MVALTDILCEQNRDSMDRLMKMATNLAQYIRDLVKQSLQHTVVIERKFGDSLMIDQLLLTFSKPDIKYKMKFECLNDQLQWVDMAIVRLHHPPSPSVTAPKSTQSSFFPLSQQQQNHSNNFCTAPATNHNHSLNIAANIKTSKSTPRQPHIYEPPPSSVNPSRMKTIRRALTTSRRKDKSPAASDTSSIRRDNRSHSLHNPSLTSLHITLPDIEQLNNYHTPPISPPSMSTNQYKWMMPAHLPELSPAQDSIIRHIAALYVETHVNDDFLLDDLLALLVDTKKPSSLWGKLKTHILTSQIHTPSDTSSLSYFTAINERKMGVSLSNLSYNDTHQVIPSSSFDTWASSCPSIKACFTQNTKVPHFFKECVLAIIAKDITMEGIFRKNGNIRGLKEMGDCLDSSQLHEWKTYCEEQTIIQLAAFIKRYLREMPEPLLTYKLHKLFLFSNSLHSPAESLLIIQYAICILPKANRDMLLLLLALLNWVARHSGKNKMDCHNLARVITPNIFYSATVKKQASARIADAWDCHGEIQVIAKMIEHYESLVKVPTDFTVILEHPKMTDYLCNSSVDLASSKQFIRIFDDLVKVKQEILSSSDPVYPPSPSHSATNNTITTLINAPSFTY